MDWPRTNNDNHSVDFQCSPSGLYYCQTGSLQRRRGRRGTQIFPKWGAVVNQVFARPEGLLHMLFSTVTVNVTRTIMKESTRDFERKGRCCRVGDEKALLHLRVPLPHIVAYVMIEIAGRGFSGHIPVFHDGSLLLYIVGCPWLASGIRVRVC
jgi:hypothetical protein